MNKDSWWYIILLPIIVIILIILSSIRMSSTMFEQFDQPEGQPFPTSESQTTP